MKQQGFEIKTTFSSDSEKKNITMNTMSCITLAKKLIFSRLSYLYFNRHGEAEAAAGFRIFPAFHVYRKDGRWCLQGTGAAVSIDNSTGKVAAIVGGREEDQEGYGLNRAYQSFRQPGSAIKPSSYTHQHSKRIYTR